MGELRFKPANENNWQLLRSGTVTAQPHPVKKWDTLPIEAIAVVPVLIASPIVAIHVTSSKVKPHWIMAGYLRQRIATGLVVGGGQNADYSDSFRVLLDRLTVVKFSLALDYELRFTPVRWLQDIEFTVWEYIGSVEDTTESMLLGVGRQLVRTDDKVGQIISYLEDGYSSKTPDFNDPFGQL